ncbi:transglutaminase family protein [uncultured Rhodospira sp.]|uniref:transglutaminase-like domain-containing protein n=1 Tax=uncultured Rhodospira sp. TaxID=1936189 RepID=UPI0026169058|nr:transglutaminase-like domain-containing protein [uncultured Rhodospira sp.]
MVTEASIRPTQFMDYDSPAVRQFVARVIPDVDLPLRDKVVRLYHAVRDEILYEIYGADLSEEGMRASSIIKRGSGLCTHKSIVFAAVVRSLGVPCRLVLTDVRNHLTSERLRQFVGGDVFHFHCLASLWLDGKWVKATPIFNKKLCQLYGMTPLDFDGTTDSLHHPFDEEGRKYMEFIRNHGEFDDFPYEWVVEGLREAHPNLFQTRNRFRSGSLVADTQREREPCHSDQGSLS